MDANHSHKEDRLISQLRDLLPSRKTPIRSVPIAIEAGEYLVAAKTAVVGRGESWTAWVDAHFQQYRSVIPRLMRMAKYREQLEMHPDFPDAMSLAEAGRFISKKAVTRREWAAEVQSFVALWTMLHRFEQDEVNEMFSQFVQSLEKEPKWWESWEIALEFGDDEFAVQVCGRMIIDGDIPRDVGAALLAFSGSPLAVRDEFHAGIWREYLERAGLDSFDAVTTASLNQPGSEDRLLYVTQAVTSWFLAFYRVANAAGSDCWRTLSGRSEDEWDVISDFDWWIREFVELAQAGLDRLIGS